ncbi:unnamed protein product [Tilletia laevis]|uniref:Uncharacterized protein n=2 Tax=Tilletia TaxID=13289 RepID=A0A8X7MWS0_9BASI|nr:hypothetical protein CF328_g2715 [Tilletia controversa]KAE8250095.1 hypothetical protein A4X06_0g2922 [Tilletia controversa]CAD6966064.1 unnamed protein product [Tilletia laevis]
MSTFIPHEDVHTSSTSNLTCKAFQLQPAPRPKNALRKQTSNNSTLSRASSASKTCGSRSPVTTTNILVPADFRGGMPDTPDSPTDFLDGRKCGERPDDVKVSSTKFTERFSCVGIPEQEEVATTVDSSTLYAPTQAFPPSTTEPSDGNGKVQNRWRGALPYKSSPNAAQDGRYPPMGAEGIQIRIIRPDDSPASVTGPPIIEPTTNTACLKSKQPKRIPSHHQVKRRGDGWGGLRAPSSWFETSFVPGPLGTPTPSVVDEHERGSTGKRKSLLAKGSGAIANIASMEVPPLPGVPFLALGSKKKNQQRKEIPSGWIPSARSEDEVDVTEAKETRIRWAESPIRSGPHTMDGGKGDTSAGLSSTTVLLKGDDGLADRGTVVHFADKDHKPEREEEDEEEDDEDDDDERWKERLVLALQAAVRHAATAASDVRASFSLPKSKSKKAARGGRTHGRQNDQDGVPMSEVGLRYGQEQEHMDRPGKPWLHQERKGSQSDGDAASANLDGCSSGWSESQSARGKTKQDGNRQERSRRGWRQVVGWALLVLLLLALLSNIIVLNVKVLSKSTHDGQQQQPMGMGPSESAPSAPAPSIVTTAPVNAATTTPTANPTPTSTESTPAAGTSTSTPSGSTLGTSSSPSPSPSPSSSTAQALSPPTYAPVFSTLTPPGVAYIPASASNSAPPPSEPVSGTGAGAGMVRRRIRGRGGKAPSH